MFIRRMLTPGYPRERSGKETLGDTDSDVYDIGSVTVLQTKVPKKKIAPSREEGGVLQVEVGGLGTLVEGTGRQRSDWC